MRTDKETARKLRLSGKSYREIRSIIGTPLATLSDWFKDDLESQKIFEILKEKYKGISREKLKLMHQARLKKIEIEAEFQY